MTKDQPILSLQYSIETDFQSPEVVNRELRGLIEGVANGLALLSVQRATIVFDLKNLAESIEIRARRAQGKNAA